MTSHRLFLVAVTALNAAFAAISLSQWSPVNAAGSEITSVVRTQKLEIVDAGGRVRASIVVHAANANTRMPDGSPQEESVVLRLINGDGRPGVKMAASEHNAGVAFINSQGNYSQVFGDGVKVTRDFKQVAAWP